MIGSAPVVPLQGPAAGHGDRGIVGPRVNRIAVPAAALVQFGVDRVQWLRQYGLQLVVGTVTESLLGVPPVQLSRSRVPENNIAGFICRHEDGVVGKFEKGVACALPVVPENAAARAFKIRINRNAARPRTPPGRQGFSRTQGGR